MKANAVGKKCTEVERAYIAGFLDADGAIMAVIEPHTGKQHGFRVRLSLKVTQHDRKILDWIRRKIEVGIVRANRLGTHLQTFDLHIRDQAHVAGTRVDGDGLAQEALEGAGDLEVEPQVDPAGLGEDEIGSRAIREPGEGLEPDGRPGLEVHDRLEDRPEGRRVDHPRDLGPRDRRLPALAERGLEQRAAGRRDDAACGRSRRGHAGLLPSSA